MKQVTPAPAKEILKYIQEFGQINFAQIDKLLGVDAVNKEYFIKFLKKSKIIEKEPGYYYSYGGNVPYSKQIDFCSYVLLDNYDKSVSYMKVDKPAVAGILKNNTFYEFMYIDKNSCPMIIMLQEKFADRYLGNRGMENIKFVFVSDDEGVIDMVMQLNLILPNSIAIVHAEKCENIGFEFPQIEYYG